MATEWLALSSLCIVDRGSCRLPLGTKITNGDPRPRGRRPTPTNKRPVQDRFRGYRGRNARMTVRHVPSSLGTEPFQGVAYSHEYSLSLQTQMFVRMSASVGD